MHYIILDLEATCWQERPAHKPSEIIEIGAVKINAEGDIIDEFNRFVRPTLHPVLSDFCKELTTIEQEEIDQADPFPEVLKAFQNWIAPTEEGYWLCSWGFYDRKQFEKDCALHDLPQNWLQNHISLKHQFASIKKLRRPVGMMKALAIEGIQPTGTHHRGIDDARNISQIFLAERENWRFTLV